MHVLTFFLSFIIYLFCMSPSITVGDSGEFCAASVTLGLAHSPGYPLFSLLGKIFTILIPYGSYAYRINILSAVSGALTVSLLYFVILKLKKETTVDTSANENSDVDWKYISAFSSLLFAIAPLFWRTSIQTEVFSLNTFFIASILLSLIYRSYFLCFFILGLGLGNHQTLVFIAPLIVLELYNKKLLTLKYVINYSFFFLLGFTIYVYLTIRSYKNPGLDWGNPETLHNLFRVITRADYGTISLTVGEKSAFTISIILKQLKRFFSDMSYQFTLAGLLAGICGWVWSIRNKLNFSKNIFITWILAGPGFILLANLPFNAETEGIMERFYILPGFLWAISIAWGFGYLQNKMKLSCKILALLLIGIIILFLYRIPVLSWRNYYLAYDYGRNILKTIEPNSVFLMDGGDDTFYSMAYLCFAQGMRKDIELHDRGGLVFRNIYGSDFRGLTKEDKEKRRQHIEKQFIGNRPIYYSTFNKNILEGENLVLNGILYKVNQQNKINPMNIYSLRSVYEAKYHDYRSRALVPIYPYFQAFFDEKSKLLYWDYAYARWPEAMWLKTNLKYELINDAYNKFIKGQIKESETIYKYALSLFPDEVSILVNLGVIEEKYNNYEKAKQYYYKAIETDSSNLDAYYNLAVIFWKEENWKQVVKYLGQMLIINPNEQRAKHYLPIAEQKLKNSL